MLEFFLCVFVEMGNWVGMGGSVGHFLLVGQPTWSHHVHLGEVGFLVIVRAFFLVSILVISSVSLSVG